MAEWREALEVAKVARELIEKHHTHLAEARILYLFREGKWSSQDRTTWGKAYKVSERDKFIHEYDFLLVINDEVWQSLDAPSRTALVDHELAHCGQKLNGNWYIIGHDLEDFAAVVRRNGLWNENVKRYLRAAENKDDTAQPKLNFYPDGEEEEANEAETVKAQAQNEEIKSWLAS